MSDPKLRASDVTLNPERGTPQELARHLGRLARLYRSLDKPLAPAKLRSLRAEAKRREAQVEEAGVTVPATADACDQLCHTILNRLRRE